MEHLRGIFLSNLKLNYLDENAFPYILVIDQNHSNGAENLFFKRKSYHAIKQLRSINLNIIYMHLLEERSATREHSQGRMGGDLLVHGLLEW